VILLASTWSCSPEHGILQVSAALFGAMILCVSIPMTIIRPGAATDGHKARDQTPEVKRLPAVKEPTILRPTEESPFRLPHYIVPEKEPQSDLTARRPGDGY
jgi:hypothetical protein